MTVRGIVSADVKELYVGAQINTPLQALKFGASWDALWDGNIVEWMLATTRPMPGTSVMM